VLKRLCSFIAAHISAYILLMNKEPLSETIPFGVLKREMTLLMKASARSFAFYDFSVAMYSAIFE
jgi:hypothetical protein